MQNEDAVNFINTEGSIEDIEIYAAGSDALDLDFSNLNIKNIFVNEAGNDCADFLLEIILLKILT